METIWYLFLVNFCLIEIKVWFFLFTGVILCVTAIEWNQFKFWIIVFKKETNLWIYVIDRQHTTKCNKNNKNKQKQIRRKKHSKRPFSFIYLLCFILIRWFPHHFYMSFFFVWLVKIAKFTNAIDNTIWKTKHRQQRKTYWFRTNLK